MPNIVNIEAGAYDPDEVPDAQDEAALEAAVEEARAEVDRIRGERYKIRQSTPKAELLDALSDTDAELRAAIDHLNQQERALGRLRRTGGGQTVSVGAAKDSEEA